MEILAKEKITPSALRLLIFSAGKEVIELNYGRGAGHTTSIMGAAVAGDLIILRMRLNKNTTPATILHTSYIFNDRYRGYLPEVADTCFVDDWSTFGDEHREKIMNFLSARVKYQTLVLLG